MAALFEPRPYVAAPRDRRGRRTSWTIDVEPILERAREVAVPWVQVPALLERREDPAVLEQIVMSAVQFVFQLSLKRYRRLRLARFGYNFSDMFGHGLDVIRENLHRFDATRGTFSTWISSEIRKANRRVYRDVMILTDRRDEAVPTSALASLDIRVGGHEGRSSTLSDRVENPASPPPDAEAIEAESYDAVTRALFRLKKRDREWLSRRYGVCGYTQQSLAEVAAHFGIDRLRARQREALILKRLRG